MSVYFVDLHAQYIFLDIHISDNFVIDLDDVQLDC